VTFGSSCIAAMKPSLLLADRRPVSSSTGRVNWNEPRGETVRGVRGVKSPWFGPLRVW